MISSSQPGYFRALIEFERDLPSSFPAAETPESAVEALGDLHRVFLELDADAAQLPDSGISPSGGSCAAGVRPRYWIQAPSLSLSQLEPLETV